MTIRRNRYGPLVPMRGEIHEEQATLTEPDSRPLQTPLQPQIQNNPPVILQTPVQSPTALLAPRVLRPPRPIKAGQPASHDLMAATESMPPKPSESTEFASLDGQSHINIHTRGLTELGRALSHFAYTPFKHPVYGPFNSMEGFWYYIKAEKPDDTLRKLTGHKAKEYGKKLPQVKLDNFKELIVEANFYKVVQNPHIEQMMASSTLPFDHYYIYGESRLLIRPVGFDFLVAGMERIREMVRSNQAPGWIPLT